MDDYERTHMNEARGVYRDKFVAPWPFFAVMGLIALIVAASTILEPAALWIPNLITLVFMALITLMFAVLRVQVTRDHVHIKLGLFGPKIPTTDIEAAEAISYDWKRYGGWGIRRGPGGEWAYNMMGDAGRAVRIRWRDQGVERSVVVTSGEPEVLASSIRQAAGLEASSEAEAGEGLVLDLEGRAEQEEISEELEQEVIEEVSRQG